MPNKLTDAEVKKALESMTEFADMVNRSVLDCVDVQTLKNALDLIKRLETKNSNLTSDLTSLQNDLTSAKAEVERLKRELNLVVENSLSARLPHCVLRGDRCAILTEDLAGYDKLIAEIKAEAYKEFADDIEKAFSKTESQMPNSEVIKQTVQICRNAIRLVLNELVGDEKNEL